MDDPFRIDSGKLELHPERVAQWDAAGDDWEKAKAVYPLYWEVTTAAACPHRCTFCSVDAIGYPNIMMDNDVLSERMAEARGLGVKSVMFAGTGEPLLHKDINGLVMDAWTSGLDVAFTTNGVALHKLEVLDKCSWVKLSINGGTSEDYAKIHKAHEKDWARVWRNVEDAAKRKGPCALGTQCVVLPENYRGMENLAKLSRDAGADYFVLKPYSQGTFSIVQRHDIDYAAMREYLEAIPGKFNTDRFKVIYRYNAIAQERLDHQYDKCRATPMFWVYSMANGDMFSCSAHLLDERFKIGNLYKQSFQEIWEGAGRKANWELMQGFNIKACRKNCRMNQNNIYLHQIKTAQHRAFI